MSDKKQQTLGWNANYFGEPKEGSLAKTIADITNKQNNLVGGKPEVADSQVVQAEKAKAELNQEGLKKEMQANTPTSNAGVQTIKKTQAAKPMGAVDSSKRKINAKKEDEDMAQKQSKSKDKGPVKVHGESADTRELTNLLNKRTPLTPAERKRKAELEKKLGVNEDVNKEIEAAQQGKVNSLVQSIIDVMYSKNEALAKDDEGDVKKTADMLKKASKAHAAQAKDLEKQIDDEGNAFGKALMAAKNKGEKTFTVAGKQYNVEAEMDKVNPVAVKKKFADRKDKDIDNDGDVDSSDKYLHKRRKAISKAVK